MVRDASSLLLNAIAASYGTQVDRATAMRVPAFTRAYKLYTHTIGTFPLREYVTDGPVRPRALGLRPKPPSSVAVFREWQDWHRARRLASS